MFFSVFADDFRDSWIAIFFLIHDEISNIDGLVNVIFLVNDEFRDDWIVVVFAVYADTKRTHIRADAGSCIVMVSAAKLYLSQYYHSTI